jgi:hypothetical protein
MRREVSKGYDIDKVYADKAHDNRREQPSMSRIPLDICVCGQIFGLSI